VNSSSGSCQQHKFRWNKQSSPVPNNYSAPSLWQVQTPVGRLPGLVGKNHRFRLAKTELENFKNWTQNRIIGSLCLETELEFLKFFFKKERKKRLETRVNWRLTGS